MIWLYGLTKHLGGRFETEYFSRYCQCILQLIHEFGVLKNLTCNLLRFSIDTKDIIDFLAESRKNGRILTEVDVAPAESR